MKITASNSEGYPAPAAIAVDTVVLTVSDGRLCVLLSPRAAAPRKGALALPGGLLGSEETAEECAVRKCEEKTGVRPAHVTLVGFVSDPSRDSRGWIPSVTYLACVPTNELPAGSDARWTPVDDLPARIPFGHDRMINQATGMLRRDLWHTDIAAGLLHPSFTVSDARRVVSVALDREFDMSNFNRMLRRSGLVAEAGTAPPSGAGRPARLFRFAR